MDLLKRSLAPILPEAWSLIDAEAARVLSLELAGRKLVDFEGPHGWGFAAVNTGRLELFGDAAGSGVHVGLRRVQPLIELRSSIVLDLMELDSVTRGLRDPDLGAVVEAATRSARVEDTAIFRGDKRAGIVGIIEASPHAPRTVSDPSNYPRAILEAKETLRSAGISGPYALALGAGAYRDLFAASEDGYPIAKRVERLLDGPIVLAQAIEGAVLLSVRGGDYELTVGQDFSIGYANRDKHKVELYLTESFTFRVLEAAAAVHLVHG